MMQVHAQRNARGLAAATFLLIGLAIANWPGHAAAQSIPGTAAYSCDFESNYCDLTEQSKLGDAPPSSLRRSTLVPGARSGSWAVRLHTEVGDDQVHGSGTWERDDLSKSPDPGYCNEGQEEWWAVSVMFPDDYVYPPGPDGGVVLDFHHNSSSGLPNLSIDTMPAPYGMRIRGQGGSTINGGQYTSWFNDPYGAPIGNVTRNQWFDFVFHIKWSSTSAGLSEAWLNGKKIHAWSGATLYTGISCYLKLANYHGPFGLPSSIVFDRLVRGASATDVALGPLEGVSTTNPTPTPTPTPTPAPAPTPGTGSAPISGGMDSSAYTVNAGQSVTFTATLAGNSGIPTGTVTFRSDGNAIAGCAATVASGKAMCTTSSLAAGTHAITGDYSGDATYGAGVAGPITETVNGTTAPVPFKLTIDSSRYGIKYGQTVTFTVKVTAPTAPTGKVNFQDGLGSIPGCSAVALSNGTATCTTRSLSRGTHQIRGYYSGDSANGSGIAGPITETVN